MTHQYKDITYSLTRSRRKTASIYIERDGSVSVLIPEELSQSDLELMLERKRTWIYRNLAEWKDLNATRIQRDFVNGEGFLYLGRTYRLRLVEDQEVPLKLKDGRFCLRADFTRNGNPDKAFRDFYRAKGKERIGKRVDHYAARMGLTVEAVKVMELKNRWASCNPEQHLVHFHWKCMMAPPTIIDYIIVHELAHLVHANHTEAFWNEVDKVMPDYREKKNWLRIHGAGMDV